LGALAALASDQLAQARDLYRRATAMNSEDPDDWYRLAQLELQLGELDRASSALAAFAAQWPELLPNISVDLVPHLVYVSEPASEDRLALMQALFDANWKDEAADGAIWYELAVAQLVRGQTDAVRQALKRIDAPTSLIRVRADKRFDALVSPHAWSFDVELAARRKLEALQRQVAAQPDRLDPRVQMSYAMLSLGMHQEVIALADETVATIAAAPLDQVPFVDLDEQVWLMNNRTNALRRLGRTDEALAELIRASQLDENGHINVSQALNLGHFYCDLDRPADALAAIASVGEMSGYGRMVRTGVELCAAVRNKDRAGTERALAYLHAHSKDAELVMLCGLLDADRIDEAASFFVSLLDDPYGRGQILEWAQELRESNPLPGERRYRDNRKALLARRDVLDAVDRVGRIGKYDLY
jgi:predicted Zn-dependent protease